MSLSNFEDAAEETLAELTQYKLPQSTTGAIVSRRFVTFYPVSYTHLTLPTKRIV